MLRRALAVLLLATLALAPAACGDHDDSAEHGHSAGQTGGPPAADIVTLTPEPDSDGFAGVAVSEPQQAPDFAGLRNSQGEVVSISDLRGKAVLVTFVYTNCPDVCPLIMTNIRKAQEMLGPAAEDLAVVAVSVDPKGDTAEQVNDYLRRMRLRGKVDWLIGDRASLEKVWTAWGIATRIPRDDPDLVEHAAPIFGISASGRVTVIYDVQVKAEELLQDIPKLQQI